MIASQSRDPLREDLESWIESARGGDLLALGQAFQSLSEYLLLVANQEQDWKLAAKCDASDLVQETFLRAHRNFGGFRGRSAEEWRGWLRSILVNSLAEQRRRYRRTGSRRLQVQLGSRCLGMADRERPGVAKPHTDATGARAGRHDRHGPPAGGLWRGHHRPTSRQSHPRADRPAARHLRRGRPQARGTRNRPVRQEVGSEDDWL